ncbi:excalibur calcium-binding domain-containing protein [Kribbella amoyensis]|uniref:excalibur calcium-binding domain-containing protein n=1 Tax=Kribbella amoyensis TaxID=996641 RepID=UPI001EE1E2B8|nr:excalibur calcium-binding domain-containing protein [Kribbella amoyensis]
MDENRYPVRGPIGRYGGPRVWPIGVVAAAAVLLAVLVITTPFGAGDPVAGSRPTLDAAPPGIGADVPVEEDSSVAPTPAETVTVTPTPTRTSISPTPTPTPRRREALTPTPTLSTAPTATPVRVTEAVAFRSCAEARAAGKAPLRRGEPGYSRDLDRNGDGVACDRGNS